VDDEGVQAEDVDLVRDGKLLTLLTSRIPQKGLLTSNGHGRGGTAQAGVFQIWSRDAVPAAALKARYLARLRDEERPYGFIVRGVQAGVACRLEDAEADEVTAVVGLLQGGGPPAGPRITEIVQVWPDGSERPVRGLVFGEVPRTAFRDLLEASRERRAHNTRAAASGPAGSAAFFPGTGEEVTISVIVPDLVFEELELHRSREIPQKPPLVPPPPPAPGGVTSPASSPRGPSSPCP